MNEDQVREKFEAWAVQHKGEHGLPYFVFTKTPDGLYGDDCANHAFDGYRAAYAQARREALEEAVEACQERYMERGFAKGDQESLNCANAIRALIKD